MQIKHLVLAAVTLAGGAFAQCGLNQLTTPPNFVANNGGASGGMVYFTLDVLNPAGVSICGISVHTGTAATAPINATLYLHNTVSDWTLLTGANNAATDWCPLAGLQGTSNGAGVGSPMSVVNATNSLDLPQGQYLIALGNGDFAHAYTNGSGANQVAADANLQFSGGKGSNAPWATSLFSPRVFNGMFDYNVGAAAQSACGVNAACTPSGNGCGGGVNMVYELFTTANPWDLSDAATLSSTDVLFVGNGAGAQVLTGLGSPIVPPVGPDLGLGDDAASAPIDLGFPLTAFGGTTSSIVVQSNGSVDIDGANTTTWTESASTLNIQSFPRVAGYWNDLRPGTGGGGGTIHVDVNFGVDALVTYNGVYLWGTTTPVTYQYHITPALITVRFDAASAFQSSAMVGIYNGISLSAAPGSSDLSAGGLVPTNSVTSSNLALSCQQVPLLGSSFDLTLDNNPSLGAVLAAFGQVGAGVPLPAPTFAAGCSQYIPAAFYSLGVTTTPTTAFSIAIPNVSGLVGLPIACQGASLGTTAVTTSNAVQGLVGNY